MVTDVRGTPATSSMRVSRSGWCSWFCITSDYPNRRGFVRSSDSRESALALMGTGISSILLRVILTNPNSGRTSGRFRRVLVRRSGRPGDRSGERRRLAGARSVCARARVGLLRARARSPAARRRLAWGARPALLRRETVRLRRAPAPLGRAMVPFRRARVLLRRGPVLRPARTVHLRRAPAGLRRAAPIGVDSARCGGCRTPVRASGGFWGGEVFSKRLR
jgi:hypothetical protein